MTRAIPLLLAFSTGCATLVSGTTQEVHLESDPPGAVADLFIGDYGGRFTKRQLLRRGELYAEDVQLPTEMELSRKHDYWVVLESGDDSMEAPLCRTTMGNPWVGGNLFFLMIPMLVDVNTGAQHTFEDEHLFVFSRETARRDTPLICRD